MGQWEAIDNSCAFTTMALKDIEFGEELYADYGSNYFDDIEGGCPCRSCNAQSFATFEMEKKQQQEQCREQEELDKIAIAGKRKEQNKRRREKQKQNE
jgi:hypothetical protein